MALHGCGCATDSWLNVWVSGVWLTRLISGKKTNSLLKIEITRPNFCRMICVQLSLALHHQVQRAPALHTRGTETIHLHAAPPSTVQLHPACWWIFLVNFSSVPGGITVWEGIALITGCSKGLGWYTASTGFIVLWDKRNKSTFFSSILKKQHR